MKIGLAVCGNSGVDYYKLDYPAKVLHSFLHLNDELYEDFVDITAEEFYTRLVNEPNVDVKTSQPPTGYILDIYEEMKAEGYTDILVVTISKELSGTYQGAVLASEMIEGVNVRVVNSNSVSYGQLFLAIKAIEYIKQGDDLETVATKIESIIPRINTLVYVDTLKYLVKNGRLSGTSGALGTLLKIKPILRLTQEDGKLIPYEKIRTSKRTISRILEIFKEETEGKVAKVYLIYTNNEDFAEEFKLRILEIRPNYEVELVPLTPVVGAHAGPGTLGLGYIFEDE